MSSPGWFSGVASAAVKWTRLCGPIRLVQLLVGLVGIGHAHRFLLLRYKPRTPEFFPHGSGCGDVCVVSRGGMTAEEGACLPGFESPVIASGGSSWGALLPHRAAQGRSDRLLSELRTTASL